MKSNEYVKEFKQSFDALKIVFAVLTAHLFSHIRLNIPKISTMTRWNKFKINLLKMK